VFSGNSQTLGWMIGAGGLGAVSGMLFLALRPSVRGLLTVIGWAGAMAGVAVIAFAWCTWFWPALALTYVAGMGMMLTAGSINTILQTIVEDRMRARVVAIYMMSFLGVAPLGALCAGALAERIGPPATLGLGGVLAISAAFTYWLNLAKIRMAIRPVYQKLGIVPRADE